MVWVERVTNTELNMLIVNALPKLGKGWPVRLCEIRALSGIAFNVSVSGEPSATGIVR